MLDEAEVLVSVEELEPIDPAFPELSVCAVVDVSLVVLAGAVMSGDVVVPVVPVWPVVPIVPVVPVVVPVVPA